MNGSLIRLQVWNVTSNLHSGFPLQATAHQNTHSVFHRPWSQALIPRAINTALHIIMYIQHQPIGQHGKVFDKRKMKRCQEIHLHWPLYCDFEAAKLTGFKLNCTLPSYVEKYFKNCVKIKFLWQEVQNISPLFHDQSSLSLSTNNRLYAQITSMNTVSVGGQDPGARHKLWLFSAMNTPNRSINWQPP